MCVVLMPPVATVQLRAEQRSMEELYQSQQELLTSQMKELRQAARTKVTMQELHLVLQHSLHENAIHWQVSQLNEEMETVRESCIDLTRSSMYNYTV